MFSLVLVSIFYLQKNELCESSKCLLMSDIYRKLWSQMILRTESVYIHGTNLYLLDFKNVQF